MASKTYSCSSCEKSYTSRLNLSDHLNVVHSEIKMHFKCTQCGKVFLRKIGLRMHMSRHGKEKLFKCSICSMKFYDDAHKKQHELIHKPIIKSQKCGYCEKLFASKRCIQKHVKRVHSSKEKFTCVFCRKGYSELENLDVHIRRHIQEKPHNCELCQKEFYRCAEKGMHMRMHTGEKLYKCKICSNGFSYLANMRRHELTHLKRKPHQCAFCGVSYATRKQLWIHILRKIGETAFTCGICGNRFSNWASLRVHQVVHQPATIKCEKCDKVFKVKMGLKLHTKNMHAN